MTIKGFLVASEKDYIDNENSCDLTYLYLLLGFLGLFINYRAKFIESMKGSFVARSSHDRILYPQKNLLPIILTGARKPIKNFLRFLMKHFLLPKEIFHNFFHRRNCTSSRQRARLRFCSTIIFFFIF